MQGIIPRAVVADPSERAVVLEDEASDSSSEHSDYVPCSDDSGEDEETDRKSVV